MAAVAAETDFIDEYVGAIKVRKTSTTNKIFFPGQFIQRETGVYKDKFRIIDIKSEHRATLMKFPFQFFHEKTMKQTLKGTVERNIPLSLWRYGTIERDISLTEFSDFSPISNPTSLKPSTNTNKQDKDLMLAYAPDRAAEIMQNYVIEYEGTRMEILGIFRSYENQLYYLIRFDDGEYKFWRMREGGRLVGRTDTAPANTAKRRRFDSARMRSMRRLADGESLDRRVENLEARMERIERRLDPEDDETIVPNADSLPSLSIRF